MRFVRSLLAASLLVVAFAVPARAGSAQDGVDEDAALVVIDHDVLTALKRVGLDGRWIDASPHGADVSRLRLTAGEELESLRALILADAEQLALGRADEIELLDAIDDLEQSIRDLEDFARLLREELVVGDVIDDDETTRLRKELAQTVDRSGRAELTAAVAEIETLRLDLGRRLAAAQDRTSRDKNNDIGALSSALADLEQMYARLDVLRIEASVTTAEDAWLLERIESTLIDYGIARRDATTPIDGLPAVTLDAYMTAGRHGIEGCNVDWRLLAGIGRIESLHGTLGGSSVALDGTTSPRILGPLLDGGATAREAAEAAEAAAVAEAEAAEQERLERERVEALEQARRLELFGVPTPVPTPTPLFPSPTPTPTPEPVEDDEDDEPQGNGFAVIEDTDGGELDGNDRWDRAVGPMQFIPGTWAIWGSDGNGDGVSDPHNYYDAAYSAARYLCHLERRSGPSPRNYVLGYNQSRSYVADVMETAGRLERSYNLSDRAPEESEPLTPDS